MVPKRFSGYSLFKTYGGGSRVLNQKVTFGVLCLGGSPDSDYILTTF